MAASRKPRSASVPEAAAALLGRAKLRGKRLAAGLSGGIDSVVLLHVLKSLQPRFGYRLAAIHVNHGLSPIAGDWARFCFCFCKSLRVPLRRVGVKVKKTGKGLEAAAREARRAAFSNTRCDVLALAHQRDDQAETVLLNLLRGAGVEGARGMPAIGTLGKRPLLRPLLDVSRADIAAYARRHQLDWIEDESNLDESLTRNWLRRRVGPLLAKKFPRWRESLARAARHFVHRELDAQKVLRAYLKGKGLRAPTEAKLAEMLRQLAGSGARTAIAHDGVVLRTFRGKVFPEDRVRPGLSAFEPVRWNGESRLPIPALGGELRFRKVRGQGIDARLVRKGGFEVRLRAGGERLQPDPKRPRRTLKNLFQEAGVPPWERGRTPLLYREEELVWVPGLGVDAKFRRTGRSKGIQPKWCPR
jgi:tRNA(Ile)-lysidine synthase